MASWISERFDQRIKPGWSSALNMHAAEELFYSIISVGLPF